MAAIVAGGSVGLLQNSAALLGSAGQLGSASHGRAGERAYLNATTGNLVIQGQDEILIGRGPDGAFLRTYNSQGLLNDDNGDNWRLNFHRRVLGLTGTVNTAGSTVTRVDADGAEAVYAYGETLDKYVTTEGSGAFDTLSHSSNTWTWTDGDTGVTETYDAANGGRLIAVTDESGNSIAFSYNGAGLLSAVQTASGETTYLDYAGSNLTRIRTVASGGATLIRTSYAYDAANRLTSVTTDLTPENTTDAKTYVTSYAYDGESRRVASMTQSDGTSLAFTYVQVAGNWRVASITDALGRVTGVTYDTVNRTTTVTDPLGRVTVLAYDAASRLTGITLPAVGGASQHVSYAYDASGNVAAVTDAKGNAVVYGYDANGNRIHEHDAAGNSVDRVYGSKNEILAETRSGGRTTRYVYDANTRLRFEVSAAGRVTEHRYNSFGQRVASIEYTAAAYDVSGLSPTATLAESQLTGWLPSSGTLRTDTAYDFRGQVASVTTDGAVTQFIYDQAGNLLQTLDARSFQTSYAYDGFARVLSSTDALGRVTLTDYQDATRKTVVTLANGLVRTSTYSAAGELVSLLESLGGSTLGETKYFYDANGHLRRTEDPTGVKTYCFYDEAGRKVGEVDGDGSLTEYRYDANNNVTRTIRYATAVAMVPENATLASIRPPAHANDRSSWAAYDAANRLVKSVDAAGFVTQRFYDGAGRLTDTVQFAAAIATAGLGDTPSAGAISPASSSADRLTRDFYDAEGNQLATLDGEGYLVEYKYDSAGQLVEAIGYATATNAALRATGTLEQLRPATAAGDIHSRTLYNARGEVAGAIDAEGYLIELVHDAAGNKTQSIRYASAVAYSAGATLASLRPASTAQDQVSTYAYDGLNRVVSETSSEGTVTQYTYDEVGNLAKTVKAANTAEVRTLNAQYDKQGRLTAELSGNGSALLTGGQTQAEIDAIWALHAIKHTYDAAGRRASTTDALGSRTVFYYDADDRLTHTINALGEVKQTVYGALGERVQTVQYGTRLSAATLAGLSGGLAGAGLNAALAAISNPLQDSRVSYAYSARGNLTVTVDQLGNSTSLTYNAFGDAIGTSQQIGAGQTLDHTYAYDRRGLLTHTAWDPAGINTTEVTQYDAFGRATQTTDPRGGVSTFTYDKLGQVVSTRDALNALRSSSYDAFGRVLSQTDALGKTTSYAYDSASRSVTMTTPEGVVTAVVANRHGDKISVTDGRGNTTTYQYDKDGNLTGTTAPGTGTTTQVHDRADRLIETVDARGARTIYTYDAAGRALTRVVDPAGLALTTRHVYDAKGHALSAFDANGVETRTEFDLKGQAVSVTVDPAGLNLRTTYSYDGHGKTLTVTQGAGTPQARITQYAYDKLGRRLSERVDPSGLNITTAYAYDANDNVVAKTSANGFVTRYVYDANDQLVYTVDALGVVSGVEYDANGRAVRTTSYANPISAGALPANPTVASVAALISLDARDRVTRVVRDDDGRDVYSIDSLGAVTQKVYDANGNVVRRVAYATAVPASTAATEAAVQSALSPNAQDQVARFFYDAANRPVYAVDPSGAVTQTVYDANSNPIRTRAYADVVSGEVSLSQLQALVAKPADRVTRKVYDAANRLAFTIDALNFVKETRYDNVGRVTQTIAYAHAVTLGEAPTVVEVQAALGIAAPASFGNTTSVLTTAPVQPYAYVESARLDTASAAMQTVPVASQTATFNGIQPYTYIASAKSDSTGTATQHVGLTVQNTSVTQSPGVVNYSWYRSGTSTAHTTSGLSIVPGYLGWGDRTPTGVHATVYQNGNVVTSLYTDVGYASTDAWSVWHYNYPVYYSPYYNVYSTDPNYGGEGGYVAYYQDVYRTAYGTRWNPVYNWYGPSSNGENWSGQVNLTQGWTLAPGQYQVLLQAWDHAQGGQAEGAFYDHADGTWGPYQYWYTFNVGTVVNPTYVRWAASTQPAGTSNITFKYRVAGSGSGYSTAGVYGSGSNHEANLGSIGAGNYEYIIEYRDAYGRLLKSASGTLNTTAGQTWGGTAAFNYTTYSSSAAAGASIRYFTQASQWAPVNHITATVKNSSGAVISTAVTYPEAESGYNGEVNLKTGSALAEGTYTVELTLHNKDGTTTTVAPFAVETQRLRQTITWASSTQPAGTTATFKYRAQGSTGSWTTAAIGTAGADSQVAIDWIAAGNYEYAVEYRDSYNRVVKSAAGTFSATGSSSTTSNVNFGYTTYNSTADSGSSITGYIAASEVPTLERVEAVVRDFVSNAIVRTATTYPEFEPAYAGNVNLAIGTPLADGRYNITVTKFGKDGSSSAATFYYEVGPQPYAHRTTTISWSNVNQPAGTTAEFAYTLAGQSGETVVTPGFADGTYTVTFTQIDDDGVITGLASGTYNYTVRYKSGAQVLLAGTGQFTSQVGGGGNGVISFPPAPRQAESFAYDAAGRLIQTTDAAGFSASQTYDAVGSKTSHTDARGFTTTHVYDAAGRASFTVDAAGYVTQRVHDAEGNVTKEVRYANALQGAVSANPLSQIAADPAKDRVSRSIFDAANQARYSVDGEGYATERLFDAFGQEVRRIRYAGKVTVVDGATVASLAALLPATVPASAVQEEARYDKGGRVFEVVDGEGVVTRNVYNALGQKTDVIRALGTSAEMTTRYAYDTSGRRVEETLAFGTAQATTTRIVLNAFGERVQIIDPRGHTTTQAFDQIGRKTSVTDALGNITRTVYDAYGNAIKVTDPRGNSGYFYYGANNKVRFHVDPLGYVSEYRYDAHGSIIDEVRYANALSGAYDQGTSIDVIAQRVAAAANGAADRQTTKAYDRLGQVTAVTYHGAPTSYTEAFVYDAFGNKIQYKDRADAVFDYEYDARGLLKRELAPQAEVVTAVLPNVVTQSTRLAKVFDYDAFGNRTRMLEAVGLPQQRETRYVYDRLGRATRGEAPFFSVFDRASGTSTVRTPVVDKVYDAAGNVVMETAPDGSRVLSYYDALNRRIAVVDAENVLREYEYDAVGNLIRERTYGTRLTGSQSWQARPAPVNPDDYRELRHAYDANNLRIGSETREETHFSWERRQQFGNGYYDDPVRTASHYNANGDVIKTVDGNGNKTHQFYDALGNRVLQVDPLGYVIQWEYNSHGQVAREVRYELALPAETLVSLADATLPALAAWNPQSLIAEIPGQKTIFIDPHNPNNGSTVLANNRVTEYLYDQLGRVTTERKKAVDYATVQVVENNGQFSGHLTEQLGDLDTRFEYDGNDRLKAVILPGAHGRTDYVYNALGQRIQELNPEFQAFNGRNQALVTTREETRWAYDAHGNAAVQTQFALTAAENRETRSSYDSAGRLRMEVGAETATTFFDYDIAGNVLRRSRDVKDVDDFVHTYRTYYAYDRSNREISHQDIEDEGKASQVIRESRDTRYNAYGDIEAKGTNRQYQEQYKYDRVGRLFSTNSENGTPRLYLYDANGNPVAEVHAIDGDLSTVNGLNGPMAVTGPAQIRLFSPLQAQMTWSQYDARNQITDVFEAPMEFGNLVAPPVVQETGAPGAPAETLTDLRQEPLGPFEAAAPLPTQARADATVVQSESRPRTDHFGQEIQWPATPPVEYLPVELGGPGMVAGIVDLPIEVGDTTDVVSPDGLTRTVTEHITKTSVKTEISAPHPVDLSVIRTVTTTRDEITRKTTFIRRYTQTENPDAQSLEQVWKVEKKEEFSVKRTEDIKLDRISRRHVVSQSPSPVNHGWYGSAGITRQGMVSYSPATQILVTVVDENGGENGYGTEAGYGYQWVHVDVPPISYYGNDEVKVIQVSENGTIVTETPVPLSRRVSNRILNDAHQIIVKKGSETLATISMNWDSMSAVVPLSARVTIKNEAASYVRFGSETKSSQPYGGVHEFNFDTALPANQEYDYQLLDANQSLLAIVHGNVGGPHGYKYWVEMSDRIELITDALDDLKNERHYFRTPESEDQNNYLRRLLQETEPGTAHEHIIHRTQSHNAFGEIVAETDVFGHRTDLTYNDLGRLVRKQDPATDVHFETGDPDPLHKKRPTTQYYYDELGQLVGTQDAVSLFKPAGERYISTRKLVNGRVEREFDAFGNDRQFRYDRLGNQRLETNQVGLDVESLYDRNGRLRRLTRYDAQGAQHSYDDFEYDLAGNRIAHTNALSHRETYLFDGQGRIRRHRSFAGTLTHYDYSYLAAIGGVGGVEKRTRTAGLSGEDVLIDQHNYFGKILYHRDLGGHEYSYSYNSAGWLKAQKEITPGRSLQNIVYEYYYNGYLKAANDFGVSSFSNFQYDRNGNRTLEAYRQVPFGGGNVNPYQLAVAEYDELNRVKRVRDDARFEINYTYDANGNRRSVESRYFDLVTNRHDQPQKFYYVYDRMNRFVITMGQRNAAGNIERGTTGFDIQYDAYGRRRVVLSDHAAVANGTPERRREDYTYDPNHTVRETLITNLTNGEVRRAVRENDALGRVIDYREFYRDSNGTFQPTRHIHSEYDADNRPTLEETRDTLTLPEYQSTEYTYGGNGILVSTKIKSVNSPANVVVNLDYAYEKWDSYKESTLTISGQATDVYSWQPGTSRYTYNSNGHIASVFDSQAHRTLVYINNHLGQVLKRNEFGAENPTSPAIRYFYSLNGIIIGDVGTDRVPSRVDYAQALADYDRRVLQDVVRRHGDRIDVPNPDAEPGSENGYILGSRTAVVSKQRDIGDRIFPVTSADFDQNYQPINDTYPGRTASSYVTRGGEDLRAVARAVWGDGALWYLLADANGLTGGENLPAGMRLTVPNVVTNVHNNSETFRPYDAGLALGDTMPKLPDPPPPPRPSRGCGAFNDLVRMVASVMVADWLPTPQNYRRAWDLHTENFNAREHLKWSLRAQLVPLPKNVNMALHTLPGMQKVEAAVLEQPALYQIGRTAATIVTSAWGGWGGAAWDAYFTWVATGSTTESARVGAVSYAASYAGNAVGTSVQAAGYGPVAAAAANTATSGVVSQAGQIAIGQRERFDWRAIAAQTVVSAGAAYVGGNTGGGSLGQQIATRASLGIGSNIATAVLTRRQVNFRDVILGELGSAAMGSFGPAPSLATDLQGFDGRGIAEGMEVGWSPAGNTDVGAAPTWTSPDYSLVPAGSAPRLPTTIGEGYYRTAQRGDTVWEFANGDANVMGAIRAANGLPDADRIEAGRDYWIPARGSYDVDAARASFAEQAALWQAKDHEARVSLAAQAATDQAGAGGSTFENRSVPIDPRDGLRAGPTRERAALLNGTADAERWAREAELARYPQMRAITDADLRAQANRQMFPANLLAQTSNPFASLGYLGARAMGADELDAGTTAVLAGMAGDVLLLGAPGARSHANAQSQAALRQRLLTSQAENQSALRSSDFNTFVRNEGRLQESLGIWPPHMGRLGPETTTTLQPGTLIDRYGVLDGRFASPIGTPFGQRALPSYYETGPYNQFEVLRPIEGAVHSRTLPWFGQPGTGPQYELDRSVQWYLDNRYLGRRQP